MCNPHFIFDIRWTNCGDTISHFLYIHEENNKKHKKSSHFLTTFNVLNHKQTPTKYLSRYIESSPPSPFPLPKYTNFLRESRYIVSYPLRRARSEQLQPFHIQAIVLSGKRDLTQFMTFGLNYCNLNSGRISTDHLLIVRVDLVHELLPSSMLRLTKLTHYLYMLLQSKSYKQPITWIKYEQLLPCLFLSHCQFRIKPKIIDHKRHGSSIQKQTCACTRLHVQKLKHLQSNLHLHYPPSF